MTSTAASSERRGADRSADAGSEQLAAIEPADMRARLRASALRIDELGGHLKAERALRDGLIVQAVEELRMAQREVATAAGVNQQRVHQILADH
jgi:hypothetical protein